MKSTFASRWRPSLWLAAAAIAAVLGESSTVAEELQGAGAWYEHTPATAWRDPFDPTLVSRRLLTQFEFEDYAAGDERAKWLWNLRWAFPLAQDLALGVQVEAPLNWAETSGEDDLGLGDLEARTGLIMRLHDRCRFGLVVNAKFPTASNSLLGDDRLELRPLAALRWEATPRLDLGVNLEYTFTPRDEDEDRVSATELKLPVALKLSDDWSCFASYNPRWNDVGGTWRHRLEAGVTYLFGPRKEYALSIGGELPLKDESFEWKGVVGLACYFK